MAFEELAQDLGVEAVVGLEDQRRAVLFEEGLQGRGGGLGGLAQGGQSLEDMAAGDLAAVFTAGEE